MGIGFSTYIEACSIAPSKVVGSLGAQAGLWESGKVQVHPTGKVSVFTGSHSHGQGHETTMAQIVADSLGTPMDDIEIVHGDTGRVPFGMGTYGSRSASVGGTAIVMSLDKIKEKGKKIAAHLLEANPKDMEYVGGSFVVKGSPQKAIPFGQVALTAYVPHNYPEGVEPGLEETSFYDPSNFCFPFGAHACVVEVDPDTGHLVSGSMMDYTLPKADMLPFYETDRTETPTPVNPLGVKGAGETGTIASTPAVVNAVVDALSGLGVDHIDAMPMTPERVWKTTPAAQSKQEGRRRQCTQPSS